MTGLLAAWFLLFCVFLASVVAIFGFIFYLGLRIGRKEGEDKLNILRRYHGGDGSVSIKDVMKALGK